MALITCPECGGKVSDTCDSCIHCGYRFKLSSGYPFGDGRYNSGKDVTVLVERGGPGSMVGLCVFTLILATVLLIFFGTIFLLYINDIKVLPLVSFLFFMLFSISAFSLVAAIIGLVKISRATHLTDPCVIYHKAERIIELTVLGGAKVRIKPNQIINVKAGVTTDYMLVVWYVDKYHTRQKANLGFPLNREVGVQMLIRLKNRVSERREEKRQ